ncbi:MAG: hypothetical protein ABI898_04295 [Sphingomonadales bacterium]
MNRDLFISILATDSYNRGYDKGIKINIGDVDGQNEIGRSLGNVVITGQNITAKARCAGFCAISYDWPTYSFTVHGPEEFDKPIALHLREKIANAAFVVAITSFCRSQLFRWSELADWEKIKIVGCGIDDAFFDVPVIAVLHAPPTSSSSRADSVHAL